MLLIFSFPSPTKGFNLPRFTRSLIPGVGFIPSLALRVRPLEVGTRPQVCIHELARVQQAIVPTFLLGLAEVAGIQQGFRAYQRWPLFGCLCSHSLFLGHHWPLKSAFATRASTSSGTFRHSTSSLIPPSSAVNASTPIALPHRSTKPR